MINEPNPAILRFLIELRKRLLNCLVVLMLFFGVAAYFANTLYAILALPLIKNLPKGQGLLATNIMAPFFTPLEFSFMVAFFMAIPIFLYQLWSFVAPALYSAEKRWLLPLLFISIALFYLGVAFAYFVIFPIVFHFLIHTAPKGILVNPDISQYLEFTLRLFLLFGCIFEIPIATILLVWSGSLTCSTLIKIRPYVIVSAFVFAMFLGPPDVLSQILIAIPFFLLYELGILLARFFVKQGIKINDCQE